MFEAISRTWDGRAETVIYIFSLKLLHIGLFYLGVFEELDVKVLVRHVCVAMQAMQRKDVDFSIRVLRGVLWDRSR